MKTSIKYYLTILLSFLSFLSFSQFEFEQKKEIIEEINELSQKGNEFFRTNLDSSEYYILKALELAQFRDLPSQKAHLYFQLANIADKSGDTKKSFEYLELAGVLSNELDEGRLNALIEFQKGNLFMRMSQMDLATKSVLKAIKHFESTENKIGLADSYQLISSIYSATGNREKQKEYILNAIQLNTKQGRESRVAVNLANFALYHFDVGQIDSATIYMKKSIDLMYKFNDTLQLAKSYAGISGFYSSLKEFDSAFYYLGEAKKRLGVNPNPFIKIEVDFIEAGIYFEKGDFLNALKIFDVVSVESKRIGYLDRLVFATKGKYESYRELGEYKKSLSLLEEYNSLQDSLDEKVSEDQLLAMEMEANFKIRELEYIQENNELKYERDKEALEARNKNYIIGIVILIALILIGLISYFLRKRILKSKEERKHGELLKKDLESKNKELVSNAMRLMRRNEEIDASITVLKAVRMGLNKTEQQEITKVVRNLEKSMNVRSWEDFELSFKELYSSFYDDLNQKHPDLTPTEIKVCSFLKLGLNSKQIAELMSKTSQSVEVDRSRIRKKMNLTNKKIGLQEYLMQEF